MGTVKHGTEVVPGMRAGETQGRRMPNPAWFYGQGVDSFYDSWGIGSPNTCIRRVAQAKSDVDKTRSRISSISQPLSSATAHTCIGVSARVLEYTSSPAEEKSMKEFFVVLASLAYLRGDETHGPHIRYAKGAHEVDR